MDLSGLDRAKARRYALRALAALAVVEALARAAFLVDAPFLLRGEHDVPWRRAWRARPGGALRYPFDGYDARRGWALKPDLNHAPAFDGKTVTSDERGARGAMHAGFRRVVLLGDSFTFGEDVGDDETYAHQLETLLKDAEVVNLGVHDYGVDQMLLSLEDPGLTYQPDVVVLGFAREGMVRNALSFRDYAKPRYVAHDGEMELTGVPVAKPASLRRRELFRSRFLELVALLRPPASEAEVDDITAALLDQLRKTVEKTGARFVIANLPTSPSLEDVRHGDRFLAEYCLSRGAECVDLRRYAWEQAAAGRAFPFTPRGYWAPEAHRVIAEGLARVLGQPPR